jgi:predicted secreted Zn-dependent protease
VKDKRRMMRFLARYIGLSGLALIAGCTSVGERTLVSVDYYTISGQTFSEVDKQISIHGPEVTGVGKALASTGLQMLRRVRYSLVPNGCVVSSARINVKARVTLPRHKNAKKLKNELAVAWNSLEEYARVHEAVHLAIADQYALRMEREISGLPVEENCVEMRESVRKRFDKLYEEHYQEQLAFDESEKERIRKIASQSRRPSAVIPRS